MSEPRYYIVTDQGEGRVVIRPNVVPYPSKAEVMADYHNLYRQMLRGRLCGYVELWREDAAHAIRRMDVTREAPANLIG